MARVKTSVFCPVSGGTGNPVEVTLTDMPPLVILFIKEMRMFNSAAYETVHITGIRTGSSLSPYYYYYYYRSLCPAEPKVFRLKT
jgi:hypothetical protein